MPLPCQAAISSLTRDPRRLTVFHLRLACDEPRLRAFLQSWLDTSGLAPPSILTLDVRVVEALPEEPLGPIVFRQPMVEIRVGPPPLGLHIAWTRAAAVATLLPGSTSATVLLTDAAVARLDECVRSFLMTVLIFLLRRAGWHHIHAAAATDPSGRGWLIVGDTHCGKSTTVALLGALGWPVTTDDAAFLTDAGDRAAVVGYRAPIALRGDAYRLFGRREGTLLATRHKVAYWPEELGSQWVPTVEPDVLLFTSIGTDRTRAEPIGAGQALAQLVRSSAWVAVEPELADEHLDLITRLARQARRYRVSLGQDLFTEPTRLEELVQ